MRPKSLVLFALALGCGSIAAVGINQVLANRHQPAAVSNGETVPIFVALADVDLGEQLNSAKIKLEEWPRDKVPPGAVTRIEEVDGRRTRTKVFAGEPILAAKLLSKDANSGSATDFIPKGFRVVAVKVDDVSGGSSLIKPGDRVDVIVHISGGGAIVETTTRTILQDIKVFAVNDVFQRSSDVETDTIVARTISLLVTPDQSELVTLASEMGRLRLVMRSIEDETLAETRGASMRELLGGGSAGDREKEDLARGDSDNPLIGMLNQQQRAIAAPPSTPVAVAEPPAAPPSVAIWKMIILEGSEAREVEFSATGIVIHEMPQSTPNETSQDADTSDGNTPADNSAKGSDESSESDSDKATDSGEKAKSDKSESDNTDGKDQDKGQNEGQEKQD